MLSDPMEAHTFFLQLLIILLTARVFAEIATRLQMPSVIGELMAGIILGPSLLGWVSPVETLRLLAEIGIILLLFEVGLDTDISRLIKTGSKSFLVAGMGFLMPFLLGTSASYWLLDQTLLVALFIGGTITATSIGITVRALKDLNCTQQKEGQIVLGAAVLDDILGIVLLAVLYEFSVEQSVNYIYASKVLLFIAAFFLLAPIAAKLISLLIKHYESASEIPGLLPTSLVALVLFFAWLAHIIGAPEILGGFAAGLALSRRFFLPFGMAIRTDPEFAGRIEQQMSPIIRLFTPIFFVFVGLNLSFHEIDWSSPFVWQFTTVIFIAAVGGKLIGALLLAEPWPSRWMIGIAMIPRGEVGIIFTELGRVSGILNNEIYASLIIVIAVTTLISPLLMKWLYGYHRHYFTNRTEGS